MHLKRLPLCLALLCACAGAAASPAHVEPGVWGGQHLRLEVTDQGATAELDCAHGSISQPIPLRRDGRFAVAGTFVGEHHGPVREGEAPNAHPARWEGRVTDGTMTLTITLTDGGGEVGTFELVHGREAKLTKCL
jgi:hypothetical protein